MLSSNIQGKGSIYSVAVLLEDSRVREGINAPVVAQINFPTKGFRENRDGATILHEVCINGGPRSARQTVMLRLLMAADADPCIQNAAGRTPLQILKAKEDVNDEAVAVLEEGLDAQRARALLRLRRLVVLRRKQGEEVVVKEEEEAANAAGRTRSRRQKEEEEEDWRRAVVGSLGGGPGGAAGCLPRDVFTRVMDMLLLVWAPLRKPYRWDGWNPGQVPFQLFSISPLFGSFQSKEESEKRAY